MMYIKRQERPVERSDEDFAREVSRLLFLVFLGLIVASGLLVWLAD